MRRNAALRRPCRNIRAQCGVKCDNVPRLFHEDRCRQAYHVMKADIMKGSTGTLASKADQLAIPHRHNENLVLKRFQQTACLAGRRRKVVAVLVSTTGDRLSVNVFDTSEVGECRHKEDTARQLCLLFSETAAAS